jgi:hypothetical protein
MEPVIGTCIGIIIGLSVVPGAYTICGGLLCLFGTVVTIVYTSKRERQQAQQSESQSSSSTQLSSCDSDPIPVESSTVKHSESPGELMMDPNGVVYIV